MAAFRTSLLGSSFRAPCMTAVRMALEWFWRLSRSSISSVSQMKPMAVKDACFWWSAPVPTLSTKVCMSSGHWFRGISMAAMAAINWAAAWPARELLEDSVFNAKPLTFVLMFGSTWVSQRCCTCRSRPKSRAEKEFLRANAAAIRMLSCACSFASSDARWVRYPDWNRQSAFAKAGLRSLSAKLLTKSCSAAWLSWSSAFLRTLASAVY